ncbi:glycosyltransferase [Jiangella alba]|uniref:VOC domain-containing protein n=1 Tax=Jiangella alba TaxID=561176 RepID=A0A1H5MHT9_9ACTN|nr:glycosyltransferase [Jiangella alba]SEE88018.1 hypothetical protein SAMN04488561_3136 [Jiangella alba]
MTDYYNAFEISPVPEPADDAVVPEIYRGIYGMPMFLTVPTADLAASVDFWTRGLGFVDLFTVPGQVTHLRRWAFQDVLLMPGEPATGAPAATVSFSCVLSQLDGIARDCAAALPGSTGDPAPTPWNTVDLHVVTPERTHVVMTAARPWDPESAEAELLRAVGIEHPSA